MAWRLDFPFASSSAFTSGAITRTWGTEIGVEVTGLAARARDNQLALEDLQGGTFSITNGGVFGSLMSTPLLNPPQSAILGMHKIEKRPVVVDDEIVAAGVTNPRVVRAMRTVPRHEHVPFSHRRYAYYDMALPIGDKQTISSPFIVAYMTEQLELQGDEKVLEVGTGCGITAAGTNNIARNSIIAENLNWNGGIPITEPDDCDGSFTSESYNLIGHPGALCNGFSGASNDLVGAPTLDPQLGGIGDHGGPTPTILPDPGSPTIDGGNPAAPATRIGASA